MKMKLMYRGIKYDYSPASLEMSASETVGQYRGQTVRRQYFKNVPVPQPSLELQYRGVMYCTQPIDQESAAPVATTMDVLPNYPELRLHTAI